jgi:hypothetical protein
MEVVKDERRRRSALGLTSGGLDSGEKSGREVDGHRATRSESEQSTSAARPRLHELQRDFGPNSPR